ncbi:MAG: DUF5678 domain-containing protein [Patescibacteria group bacterium]
MERDKAYAKKVHKYANQWVALVGQSVVAAGDSLQKVQREVERKGIKNYVFHRVPPPISLAP